jgi:phosphopantothenoylcysteine decarboxylase/phosphopantothenate--cysteine ligase
VANDVSDKNIGFDSDDNEVTLITQKEQKLLEKQTKKKISNKIIEFISRRIND